MPSQLLLNAIYAGTLYGLVAISFGLIQSTTRIFHIAHAVVYTGAAYLTLTFVEFLHLPLPVGILAAIAGATALGLAMELCIYRPVRQRRCHPFVSLLCSLGLFVALQNTISLLFGDATRTLHQTGGSGIIEIASARLTNIQAAGIVVSTLLAFGLWVWLRYFRAGRMIRAVANSSELSAVVGVNNESVFGVTFVVSSALVSVAGIVSAFDTDLTPSMGFKALLLGVVASVVGGSGSVPGAFVGGLVVGLVQHLSSWKLPTHWQDTFVFVVLVAFLVIRPQGLMGTQKNPTNQ
jgi:branched-chain amino acid transport system permease protein